MDCVCGRRYIVPNSNVYLQPYCRQTKERLKQIPIYREVGKSPPLCKGRWLAQARRRDYKKQNSTEKQSLSRLRRQLPLHKGAFLVHLCLVNFPDKHCICVHKRKIRHTYFEVCRIFIKLSFRGRPYTVWLFCWCFISSEPRYETPQLFRCRNRRSCRRYFYYPPLLRRAFPFPRGLPRRSCASFLRQFPLSVQ